MNTRSSPKSFWASIHFYFKTWTPILTIERVRSGCMHAPRPSLDIFVMSGKREREPKNLHQKYGKKEIMVGSWWSPFWRTEQSIHKGKRKTAAKLTVIGKLVDPVQPCVCAWVLQHRSWIHPWQARHPPRTIWSLSLFTPSLRFEFQLTKSLRPPPASLFFFMWRLSRAARNHNVLTSYPI